VATKRHQDLLTIFERDRYRTWPLWTLVTAASRSGDSRAAAGGLGGGDEPPASVRVQAVSDLGEIAPVCVSEERVEPTAYAGDILSAQFALGELR
jgi:hypothetical protein